MSVPVCAGVGRIRRDGFYLHIGDVVRDMGDLRNHRVFDDLIPILRAFDPPPTAAECVWLMRFLQGYLPWTQGEFANALLALLEEPR